MESEFRTITLDRKRLIDLLNKIGNSDLVSLGIETSRAMGDKLLWISNNKFDDKRIVVE